MGKAFILSGGDSGLYRVRIDYGEADRDAELARIDEELASVGGTIAGLESTMAAFVEEEEDPIKQALDVAVDAYVIASRGVPRDDSAIKQALTAHQHAIEALFDVRMRYELLKQAIDEQKARQVSLQLRRDAMALLDLAEDRDAWCADFTTGATGEVATLDIPGESAQIVIAPGGAAPAASDGALVARDLQSGAQLYFNAAILPGWQRFMPTFRTGEITAIDIANNIVDVALDDVQSSAQALEINQASSLSGVPVTYMTCDAAAFVVGDQVVVKFDGQAWDAPRVVGFSSNPRPCNMAYAACEYWQHLDDGSIFIWGISALINVQEKTVSQSWSMSIASVGSIMSLNSQPHFEVGGSFGVSWNLLVDATGGGENVALPEVMMSVQQAQNRLYGIRAGTGSDPQLYRVVIEAEIQDGAIVEVSRFTVGGSSDSLNTLSVSGGHVAVGGFVAGDYGVRVFDAVSKALVAQFPVVGPVESVDMTARYLAVLHWGAGSSMTGHTVTLFKRAGATYAPFATHPLTVFPFSVAVIGDRLVAKESGTVWIWMINHDTGAITFEGAMTPFSERVSEIGGNEYSQIMPDGSGTAGHEVCSVAMA